MRTMQISAIGKVKGGKRLPKGEVVQSEPTDHPYLRVTDFTPSGVDQNNVKFITEAAHRAIRRYTINEREVYISIAGTVGLVGIVPLELSGANLTENAAKITEIDAAVYHRYLMYFLRSPLGQAQIVAKTGGAAQPKLALYRIEEIEFPLLPLEQQRHIASILGAYDDLIEVNRRRVAVLEEMARGLFEEWFVRFRFPGHETVPLHDTPNGPLPEGWTIDELGAVLRLRYGKALKADSRTPGTVSVIGSSGVVGSHTQRLVEGPGIVVGRKGNVGSVIWSTNDFWPIDTAYFVETALPLMFVYELIRRVPFQNTDAAVPGLNRDYALSRKVTLPPIDLVERYGRFAQPLRDQLDALEQSNERLAAARDLLLPRLISGQLSVEAAERELEDAA